MAKDLNQNSAGYLIGRKIIVAESLEVVEWSPDPVPGKAPPTEVHILMTAHLSAEPESKLAFVLRLKSREAGLNLMSALGFHIENVWPQDASVDESRN